MPPELEITNRVRRKYWEHAGRFVRVCFAEETGERMYMAGAVQVAAQGESVHDNLIDVRARSVSQRREWPLQTESPHHVRIGGHAEERLSSLKDTHAMARASRSALRLAGAAVSHLGAHVLSQRRGHRHLQGQRKVR